MQTEDLMTRKVHTCRPGDTLADAARTMWERDVGWLPVVTPDGHLVSVVTDRDICMGGWFCGVPLAQSKVCDVMSRRLVTCSPSDDVADVAEKMRAAQVRRMPVVSDDGCLVGAITLSDVVHGLQRDLDDVDRSVGVDILDTLAAITEPRGPSSGPVSEQAKRLSPAGEGDVWMYE